MTAQQETGEGRTFLIGFMYGAIVMGGLATIAFNMKHTDEKLKNVQTYNHQLGEDLGKEHQIQDLRLDPDESSFSFTTEDGHTELKCTGEYRVKDHVAKVAGDLTCSQKVTVGSK